MNTLSAYLICALDRPPEARNIPGELYVDEQIARRRACELQNNHKHVWIEEHVIDECGSIQTHNKSKTLRSIFPNPALPYHMDSDGIDDVHQFMSMHYQTRQGRWVSLHELKAHVRRCILAERGTLNGTTPRAFEDLIDKYERREKLQCGCKDRKECDCVVFGLNDDNSREYEYFIP